MPTTYLTELERTLLRALVDLVGVIDFQPGTTEREKARKQAKKAIAEAMARWKGESF